MRNNNYDDALAWYSKALELNPESSEHTLKRSEVYTAIGSWEDALKDANKVQSVI